MLAHNHREGPDWIPATVIEVLGPVTYTVETEQGYKWKRHADQMKNWLNSVPSVVQAHSETISDEMETADGTEGDPPATVESTENSSAGETSEAAETLNLLLKKPHLLVQRNHRPYCHPHQVHVVILPETGRHRVNTILIVWN